VAIVGPSGSGKSTLCDTFLGLLNPASGQTLIGNQLAATWVKENPKKVSYFPQDVALSNGNLIENVCLGVERSEINWDAFTIAVKRAQFSEVIDQLENGIDTNIGVSGVSLSGGKYNALVLCEPSTRNPAYLLWMKQQLPWMLQWSLIL
jgi:ABC-type multidrug transport system fused ATPase/permease subunit